MPTNRQGLKSVTYLIRRFRQVESRIHSVRGKLIFPLRLIRFLLHHYHLLPGWVKATKFAILICLIFSQPALDYWQKYRETQSYYDQFYPYYRRHFQQAYSDEIATAYAKEYASRYAEYYASDAYKNALRAAINQPPSRQKGVNLIRPKPSATPLIDTPQTKPSPPPRTLPPLALQVIKHFEGLVLTPYQDAGGAYSIGYGHLMLPHERYTRISKSQAEQLLLQDASLAAEVLDGAVSAPLNQSQRAALISLIYNIGGYHFTSSTLIKHLNQKRYAEAGREILRWDKVAGKPLKGLTRRRKMEYHIFTRAL